MAEIFEPGYFYHIFNRGNNKEKIFFEEKNYQYFMDLVGKYLLPVADIYCYCLIPNHFHILLRIKDLDNLEQSDKLYQPFSNFLNAYTKAINKSINRYGSLFQKNLHKIRIREMKYLQNLIAYIHLNPVKHEITEHFHNYPYSSYRSLISEKPTKLQRNEVIRMFDDQQNFIYWHNVKKYLMDEMIKEIEKIDW
ncbi:MAG: transposase [Bacteroidales bacterium]